MKSGLKNKATVYLYLCQCGCQENANLHSPSAHYSVYSVLQQSFCAATLKAKKKKKKGGLKVVEEG